MTKSSGSDSKNTLYCSFCGKSQHAVRKLFAGPTVFICEECVELCMMIIREEHKTSGSGSDSKNTLYCSFCGKSQHEVRKLIAGPTVFICDECVELCMMIFREEHKTTLVGVPEPPGAKGSHPGAAVAQGVPGRGWGDNGPMTASYLPPRGTVSGMGGPLLHIKGRLAFMKAELEIADAQERLWEVFAEALRDFLKSRAWPNIEGPVGPAGRPERLAMLEKDLAADVELLRQWKAIVETFYGGLSEEQRRGADQLLTQLFGVASTVGFSRWLMRPLQTQTLIMTPQLQQAIKMLQLSNLELTDFIDGEIQQNPLLERGERAIGEMSEIKSLDPRPGLALDPPLAQPVVPDILMRAQPEGGWGVELNAETLPRVLVNNEYYARARQAARSKAELDYLTERLHAANWLVKSLHQRAATILKVAAEIVRQQDAFFRYGVASLRPLILRDIADAIGMHESTISRVTSNKYMATPRGLYELKYFFTSAIPASGPAH